MLGQWRAHVWKHPIVWKSHTPFFILLCMFELTFQCGWCQVHQNRRFLAVPAPQKQHCVGIFFQLGVGNKSSGLTESESYLSLPSDDWWDNCRSRFLDSTCTEDAMKVSPLSGRSAQNPDEKGNGVKVKIMHDVTCCRRRRRTHRCTGCRRKSGIFTTLW